jgi:hypothetical protein
MGATHCNYPVRQWRSVATAGALALRALVIVVILGHLEQGHRASFKIRGEEGCCHSDSLKIEMAV